MYNLRDIDDYYLDNSNKLLEEQDSLLYKSVAIMGIGLFVLITFLFLKVEQTNRLLASKDKDPV
jgi:hypothetical protein